MKKKAPVELDDDYFIDEVDLNRAFGQGTDARMRGRPRHECPYKLPSRQARWWRKGWDHADQEWGIEAKRGATRPPPVLGRVSSGVQPRKFRHRS